MNDSSSDYDDDRTLSSSDFDTQPVLDGDSLPEGPEVDPSHSAPTLPGDIGRTGALTREDVAAAKAAETYAEEEVVDTQSIPRPQIRRRQGLPVVLLVGGVVALVLCALVAIFVLGFGGGPGGSGDVTDESPLVGPDEDEDDQQLTDEPEPTEAAPTAEPICECQGEALLCDGELVEDDADVCQKQTSACTCSSLGHLVCGEEVVEAQSPQCVGENPAAPTCECQGPALWCDGELIVEDSAQCLLEFVDCGCVGDDFVCDGGTVIVVDALLCAGDRPPTATATPLPPVDQPTAVPTDEDDGNGDDEECGCDGYGNWICDDEISILDERCDSDFDDPTAEPSPDATDDTPTEEPSPDASEEPPPDSGNGDGGGGDDGG